MMGQKGSLCCLCTETSKLHKQLLLFHDPHPAFSWRIIAVFPFYFDLIISSLFAVCLICSCLSHIGNVLALINFGRFQKTRVSNRVQATLSCLHHSFTLICALNFVCQPGHQGPEQPSWTNTGSLTWCCTRKIFRAEFFSNSFSESAIKCAWQIVAN